MVEIYLKVNLVFEDLCCTKVILQHDKISFFCFLGPAQHEILLLCSKDQHFFERYMSVQQSKHVVFMNVLFLNILLRLHLAEKTNTVIQNMPSLRACIK